MMMTKRLVLAVLILASLSWNFSASARAQDEPIKAPGVGNGEKESPPSIFIPYDKLKEVFGAEGAAAILPYADIQKLMKLLEEQRPKIPDAMVTKADYTMSVEKDLARVKATLSVKSLSEGWSSLSLPFNGAAVGAVTIDNEEALFRGAGNNQYLVQLPAKGDYQLTLELLVKIQSSPDRRLFAFQTPLAGITTAQITVPTADQSISVKPEAIQLPAEAADGQSSIKVNLGATERIEVSWTPEASAKPQMELLTSVQNQTLITLGDGLVHSEALLDIDVLRGELSELQILVPKSHRILSVTSEMVNVQRQTVEETDQAKIITIKFLQAISKRFPIEVHTEQALPDEHFPLAGTDAEGNVFGIQVRGAIRESGTVSIAHASESRLAIDQQEGVMRVDGASAPEAIRNRAAVHYRFYSPNFTLVGGIEPVEPRVQVAQSVTHTFQKGALKVDARLTYTVERAGVFELKMKLPPELTVDSVLADHLREFTIDDATGVLTVSFNQKLMGAIQVRVQGKVTLGEAEEEQLALPIPEPQDVFQETGMIFVYAPTSLEIDTVEEETSGVIPQDVAAQGNNQARLVAQWSYQSRPIAVTVRTVRKPTRLSARLETLVDVNEDQTRVRTRVRYQIEHAPVRFFQIDVPEAVSDKVTIEVPDGMGQALQSKTPAEEAVDGWVTWTIELQQEALGEQAFDVIYELPLERAGEEQLSELDVTLAKALPALTAAEDGEVIPLVRTVGEIGIARDRALSLSSTLDAERSESLDRRELTMPAGASDQAYRYYTQPVTLTLRSRKYEIQTVVETVISKALVEVAVGYDPQATYRCRYLLHSSERQRLLIRLPKNSEPLSVLVEGRRVDLEQAEPEQSSEQWDAYYVNVSQNNSADEQFSLTLQFLWTINPPQFRGPLGKLQLPFPKVASLGAEEDAATQQFRLAVWVPDKFHLVGTPEHFNDDAPVKISAALFGFPSSPPVTTDELNGWIGHVPTGAIDFPTEGIGYSFQTMGDLETTKVSWWEMHYMVWVLSGAIFLIGFLLRNTSWENRLGIVLAVVFIAACYAVKDSDVVAHGLAAARFGIFTVIALWLIQCVFSLRSCLVPATAGADVEVTESAEETEADSNETTPESEETKPDEPPAESPPDEPTS